MITKVPERRRADRPLRMVITTHVVCRETDAEAEAYCQHYAVDYTDNERATIT